MSEEGKSRGRRAKQLSLSVADFIETGPAAPPLGVVSEDAGEVTEGNSTLSASRLRLLRGETDPQMVLIRLIEDARWVQRRARSGYGDAQGETARLNVLKLFWSVRTELVKLLQGLGVLPRELFFQEEESDLEHLPTEVAEAVSGLLSGRLEPDQTTKR